MAIELLLRGEKSGPGYYGNDCIWSVLLSLSKISVCPQIQYVPICCGCTVSNPRLFLLVSLPTQPCTPALCELEEHTMRQAPMTPLPCPTRQLQFSSRVKSSSLGE